jgi:hypothetical protein
LKVSKISHFRELARGLLHYPRPLGSTPRRGGRSGSLVQLRRPFFLGLGAD